MGRWMEIVRKRLTDHENHRDKRRTLILGEIAPNPLMEAAFCLPHVTRPMFPQLDRARVDSGAYRDEQLWLDSSDAENLLEEFRHLRRICQREAFVKDLAAETVLDRWRGAAEQREFETWLDSIEDLLGLAVREQCWVLLLS